MKTLLILAALAVSFNVQASGNAEAGKAKAAQVCAACHGPEGSKPSAPDQPVLAGQHYDYLVKALSDYKSVRALATWEHTITSLLDEASQHDRG